MSLCVLIQDKDEIIVAGDSREAIKIKGELYATGAESPKIRVIGDQVIFTTGNASVAEGILSEYKMSGIYTIDNLQKIMNKHVKKYVAEYGARYFESGYNISQVVGFVVSCFRNGRSMVYALSSGDSNIFESIDDTIRIADGSRSNEALALLKEYEENGGQDLLEGFKRVYNSLADEGIGGTLYVFHIDRSGIKHVDYPIIDGREIKMAPAELVWSREHGIVVQRSDGSSKATFNSDEIYFEVGGQRKFWLDIPNNTIKFSGTLEAADGIFSGDLSAVGGTFTGDLSAAGGTFSGDLTAAGGTFTGTLQGVDGTFSGEISASTITGGIIFGTSFVGGTIAIGSDNNIFKSDLNGIYLGHNNFGSAPFRVNMSGQLTASNAHITGGNITGAANISVGSSISIGSKIFMNPGSFSAGVTFTPSIEIYHEPAAQALHLRAPGGVYANGVRID